MPPPKSGKIQACETNSVYSRKGLHFIRASWSTKAASNENETIKGMQVPFFVRINISLGVGGSARWISISLIHFEPDHT
jgi:hypothetical protein